MLLSFCCCVWSGKENKRERERERASERAREREMYGLLCESLHDFIKESFGDDVWKLVRERADVRLHSFVTHEVRDYVALMAFFI